MITLTIEQAQQIEEALSGWTGSLDEHAVVKIDEALAIIRAARAQEHSHPDDEAVDRFAAAMKAKLEKKRAEGRGGWEDKNQCSAYFLNQLLNEHVGKGDPVDVGNLAMMLWNRGERTEVVRAQEIAEREPVAIADGTFNHNCPLGTPLYTAPVRTKDLTEQEIQDAIINISPTGTGYFLRIARAVIAKFKEKNR